MERLLRVFMAGLPVRDASSIADGAGVGKGRRGKGEKKQLRTMQHFGHLLLRHIITLSYVYFYQDEFRKRLRMNKPR